MPDVPYQASQPENSPSEQAPSGNRVLVLISANAEWRAIRALFPSVVVHSSPYGEWFQSWLPSLKDQEQVVFLQGGWGKIAAAASTQYAISRWKPELLINLGTCGGLAGQIEHGEIILAEKTLVYDIIELMGEYDAQLGRYATQLDLSWLQEPYPQAVRRTLLVSADRDILASQVSWLKDEYCAIAGDWESGAIAYVAHRNLTRLLILRGVTDLVGESGGEAYGNKEIYRQATEKVMSNLISALPAWIKAGSVH